MHHEWQSILRHPVGDSVEVLHGNWNKHWKFLDMVELHISLKNYDLQRTSASWAPSGSSSSFAPCFPCVFWGTVALSWGQLPWGQNYMNIPHLDIETLKKLNKSKKPVKMLAKKYDAFLAFESLIKQILRTLDPDLNKAGSFLLWWHTVKQGGQTRLFHLMKSTIKFQWRRFCVWQWLSGMWRSQMMSLCTTSSWLSISWCHCSRRISRMSGLYTSKSTMGNSQRLY